MGETNRKLFVLDTNILLHEPFAIFSFQEHDVVIPMTVLEELDRIKDSKETLLEMRELRFERSRIYSGKPHQIKSRKAFHFLKRLTPLAVFQYSQITNFKKASRPSPTTKLAITESSTQSSIFKTNARHAKWFSSPKTSTCAYGQKAQAFALLKITKQTN